MAVLRPVESSVGEHRQWGRHRGPVTGVALARDHRTAVTSAYDGAVGLFDVGSAEVELLGYHSHLVNRIVANGAGTKAASCSSDYSVCIWDLKSRRRERVLLGHSDDVEDFVFVDEATGISASRDRRIIVWDLKTGAIRRILEGHDKDVLALVSDGQHVYSSGDDMTLRVWDLETGRELKIWGPFDNETDTCAIDLIRRRVVLGCDDGCLRVFDAMTGALQRLIVAHSFGIKKVAVSPRTGDILSAAYDQNVIVWNPDTFGMRLMLKRTQSTWERSLGWGPDGTQIVGGTFDGTVVVWNASTGAVEREVGEAGTDPGNPCFNEVAIGAPGEIVAVSDDGFVRTGTITPKGTCWKQKVEPGGGRVLMNAVTCNERYGLVAAGAHDHTIRIFQRTRDGLSREKRVALREGPVNCVRVAHNSGYEREIFAACYSSRIVRASIEEGTLRGHIQVHHGAVKSLRLHPKKPLGVSCGADGRLVSWTFAGELVNAYLGHTAIINDVDLDSGGERLASVSRDFTLKVFDVDSGRLLHSIAIGRKSLKSVCFWDEVTVVVGDYWGGLMVVDLNRETVQRRVVAENGISSVTRSGEHVLASSYDGTIRLVDLDLSVIQTLRAMRQRMPA